MTAGRMIENTPRVWNERANNGRPLRTTAFLLASSANGASIFPGAASRCEEQRGEERGTGESARGTSQRKPGYIPRLVVVWGSAFGVRSTHAPPFGFVAERGGAIDGVGRDSLLCLVSELVLCWSPHHHIAYLSISQGFRGEKISRCL